MGTGMPFPSLWLVKDRTSPTARLFSVISLLLPDSIPDFMLEDTSERAGLAGYLSGDDYDWAIPELAKSSTVSRTSSYLSGGFTVQSSVTVHSFIQEVVRSQLLKDINYFVEVFNATVRLLMAVWDHQDASCHGMPGARGDICSRLPPTWVK